MIAPVAILVQDLDEVAFTRLEPDRLRDGFRGQFFPAARRVLVAAQFRDLSQFFRSFVGAEGQPTRVVGANIENIAGRLLGRQPARETAAEVINRSLGSFQRGHVCHFIGAIGKLGRLQEILLYLLNWEINVFYNNKMFYGQGGKFYVWKSLRTMLQMPECWFFIIIDMKLTLSDPMEC